MWWQRKPDPRDALISVLKDERDVLRSRHDKDLERIDRLMEALARRANVELIMPSPPIPVVERIHVPNPWKDPNQVTGNFKEKQ